MLDALAMGKCIVAHPISCEGIAVTPGKDVVCATTAEEFVDSIGILFRSPVQRRAMSAAARALAVEKYSFASIGAAFADLLESVVSGE